MEIGVQVLGGIVGLFSLVCRQVSKKVLLGFVWEAWYTTPPSDQLA